MMRVCLSALPHQPSFSFTTACEIYSSSSSSSSSSLCRRRGLPCFIVCAIPARDVVIDFGNFKGCKMGTLPSSYLRWLIRESRQPQLAVWGDYAQQVLEDPYYRDKIEWESIERLAVRGDMRKRGPPVGDHGVKGTMRALGWDLSDRDAWSKVNFSLLGTSLGGRIPRLKMVSPSANTTSPSLSSKKPAIKASPTSSDVCTNLTSSSLKGELTSKKLPSKPSSPPVKQEISSLGSPQSKSLSLKEELLRRRRMRKERSSFKSTSPSPSISNDVGSPFPGRDSLLKKAQNRGDI